MRLCLSAALMVLGIACATNDKDARMVKTQVVTFPDGALVEFNGKPAGRAPAEIILPQDEKGNLTDRAEILAIPNTRQGALYPQRRVLEPGTRKDRVPDRIMVDMTRRSTNEVTVASGKPTHIETASKTGPRPPVPYSNRGKPTQAVGLDRWSPGIY